MSDKRPDPDKNNNRKSYPKYRTRQWISSGLEKLSEIINGPSAKAIHYDVTIIGSGYGGSIAASELSNQLIKDPDGTKRPIRICVLERGKEFLPGMFPREMAELPSELRLRTSPDANLAGAADGLYDIRASEDIGVLVGNGLGGGSLINAGVMEIPTRDVFDKHWPALIRNMDTDHFNQLFSDTKCLIGASLDNDIDNTIHQHATFQKSGLKKYEGLKLYSGTTDFKPTFRPATITVAMSDKESSGKVNLKKCKLCGDCATGCNHEAKESLDTNLLHKAWVNGVDIFTGATVLKFSKNNKCWTVDIVYTKHATRRREANNNPETDNGILKLNTGKVILAAGSLGSTEILLKSAPHIGLINNNIGTRFSSNGDMLAAGCDLDIEVNAIANEEIAPHDRFVGPTCTGVIDLRKRKNRAGTVVEELAVPGPLRRIYEELFLTSKTLHDLDKSDRSPHLPGQPAVDPFAITDERTQRLAIYAVISDDDAEGVMSLGNNSSSYMQDGNIKIDWPDLKNKPVFTNQINVLNTLKKFSSIGGRVVANPGWSPVPDSMSFLFDNDKGPLFTVHPLGGCPMGDSIDSAVVDHYGRVFRSEKESGETFDDLIVLDGAIVPTAVGINPALTISAVSLRAIRGLKSDWGLTDSPDNHFEQSTAVTRPVFRDCSEPIKKKETTIEILERLSGKISLKDKRGINTTKFMELTLYFRETAIKQLISTVTRQVKDNSEIGRILTLSQSKPRSTLKIYGSDYDPHALEHKDPEYSAELQGQLEVFHRERSSSKARAIRSIIIWFLNRGLRDITQATFKKPWEKKKQKSSLFTRLTNLKKRMNNTLQLASRAGEARLFEYKLHADNIRSNGSEIYRNLEKDFSFKAMKRISYTRRGNPWRQLMQARIVEFPISLQQDPPPTLDLDLDFLTNNKTPLLRIRQQNDQVNALADIASVGSYITRLLISIHLWSFPKPDTWKKRKPSMLAGELAETESQEKMIPEIIYLPIHGEENKSKLQPHSTCRLTYYEGKDKLKSPVMLIHGYSTSSTTFAHPSVKNNLAQQFHNDGRDVWLLDLRTSIGMEHSCNKPWSFETTAYEDIPLALDYIYKQQNRNIHVLAHCVGGAMFSMAILSDSELAQKKISELTSDETISEFYSKRVASVILSQVGPFIHFTPANAFRAYLTNYLLSFFESENYDFRPDDPSSISNQLMDRLLSSLPYPEQEFEKEYPLWPPWKRTAFTGLRHRMDLLYGRTFNLMNVNDEVLNNIDDIFGPPNLKTISQTIHLARYGVVTNQKGYNEFVSLPRLKARWKFPTCLIHGRENALSDVKTIWELEKQLNIAHCPVGKAHPVPDTGHQDCYIGKGVLPVGQRIITHLNKCESQDHKTTTKTIHKTYQTTIQPPWLGPIWTSSQDESDGNICYRIAMGVSPDHVKPDMVLPIPVVFDKSNKRYYPNSEEPEKYISALIGQYNTNAFNIKYRENSYWFHMRFEFPLSESHCDGIICLLLYQDGFKDDAKTDNLVFPKNPEPETRPTPQIVANDILNILDNASLDNLKQSLIPICNDTPSPSVSIAVGSCLYPANALDQIPAFNSYRRLASRLKETCNKTRPDLVILTGDQVYTDASAGICDPATSHNRFEIPYYRWLENPEVRSVLRNLPSYMMLDDHEINDNFEPGNTRQVHNKYYKLGMSAYLDFQRGHWPTVKSSKHQPQLWREFSRQGFQFIMLDTRTNRTSRSTDNYKKSHIIKCKQRNGLKNWFSRHSKSNKPEFIISPAMPFPRRIEIRDFPEAAIHLDNWSGYPESIHYLLSLVTQNNPENLILLSGDEHISNVTRIIVNCLSTHKAYTFYSVHCSGLYSPFPFANSIEENFSRKDKFAFNDSDGKRFECRTESIFLPGDGFAIINTTQKNNEWELTAEFLRGDNDEENRKINIKTLAEIK